jgi:hypothetical protein
MKTWVLDSGSVARQIKAGRLFVIDSGSVARALKKLWVIDSGGVARQVYQSYVTDALTISSGAGDDGIIQYRCWGYADATTAAHMGIVGAVGSVTAGSATLTGGQIAGFLGGDNNNDGTTNESRLYCIVRGFGADPGASWLQSITVAGTQYTGLSYGGYSGGFAQWTKAVNAGFKGASRSCSVEHL